MFHLLDSDKWERQKHFEYYMQMIPCGYTVTVRLDVENLYQQVKKCGLKFYPAFIYCTGKVVNEKREFKMGVDQEGRPGYFDVMHPNFTIFHKDDHTFSDIWSYYDDDFQTCYQNIINDMETYKDVKGPKGKEGQPPNFFCISCVPWMDFTGYSTWVPTGRPNLFPIITFGKYVEEEGRRKLSAALTISHASADGYHASMFFERLQEVLDEFVIEKNK